MTKAPTCTDVITSKAWDSPDESVPPSTYYRGHHVNPVAPPHSPVKLIVVIALGVFFIPLTYTLLKQTDEERQAWVNTHPQYQDHTTANLAQIFQSVRQLLV